MQANFRSARESRLIKQRESIDKQHPEQKARRKTQADKEQEKEMKLKTHSDFSPYLSESLSSILFYKTEWVFPEF